MVHLNVTKTRTDDNVTMTKSVHGKGSTLAVSFR